MNFLSIPNRPKYGWYVHERFHKMFVSWICLTYICLVDFSILIKFISSFRGVWCAVSFLFYLWQKFLLANSADPDQTPRSAASDLGLHCLPRLKKKKGRQYGLSCFLQIPLKSAKHNWILKDNLFFSNIFQKHSYLSRDMCKEYLSHRPTAKA